MQIPSYIRLREKTDDSVTVEQKSSSEEHEKSNGHSHKKTKN